jgi:hypothetical protein
LAATEIRFDAAAFLRRLRATSRPALDRPVAAALRDTGNTGRQRATSIIQRRNGLRGGISFTVRGFGLTIRSSRAPNPLIRFGAVQTPGGVNVNAWGRRQTLRSAFITSRGVYRRRGGAGRLPIRQLWGPTTWGTLRVPEVQSVVAAHMRNTLKASLIRRISAAQRRGA